MASGPITSWQIDGETVETVADFIFLGSKITADGDCSHEIKRRLLLRRKVMTNLDSILKSRDITLTNRFSSQSYGFSSSRACMWQLDFKKSWAPNNWCFLTVLLEKTLESPLGCKELKPVNPKWNQSWIFIGRTDAEAETPILWPPDAKYWLIEKTLIRKLWYIYTIEYYSSIKKNTFESVLMRWMKLEPIIQSEVSQKEKHQYSILTHIYGI